MGSLSKQEHAAHLIGQGAARNGRTHSTSNQDDELGVPARSARQGKGLWPTGYSLMAKCYIS